MMNYGLLNFKAQNGKAGIFYVPEKKKPLGTYGYKSKELKHTLRKEPWNRDKYEEEEEETPKPKPKVDFIKRNREKMANKPNAKKPGTLKPVKKDNSSVTLTQEQLNAILASVGQVATGKEDNVRISLDNQNNSITIESPRQRKSRDYDSDSDYEDSKYRRDSREKESKKKETKTKPSEVQEEVSIYAFFDDMPSHRTKASDRTPKKARDAKKDKKKVDDKEEEENVDNYKRDSKRDKSKDKSRERGRKKSRDRDDSRDRDESRDRRSRDRERSRDRLRYSRDRKHHSSDESDRDSDYERTKERYREKDKIERKNRKNKDRNSSDINDSDSGVNDKKYSKEDRGEKRDGNDKKDSKTKVITPREIAGVPLALPWKHMTRAERRRLMLARLESEAAAKEAELLKTKVEAQERDHAETEKNGNRDRKNRDRHDVDSRENDRRTRKSSRDRRRRDSSHEREDSYDRRGRTHESPKRRDRRDDSRDRRRRRDDSRDRNYRRDDSRERKQKRDDSPERRHSRDRDDSIERRDHRQSKRKDPSPRRHHQSPPPAQDDSHERNTTSKAESLPPPRPLTFAEKKRLQWERDRMEAAIGYDPWGKPGAGAPIRTKSGNNIAADYRARQDDTDRGSGDYEVDTEEKMDVSKLEEDIKDVDKSDYSRRKEKPTPKKAFVAPKERETELPPPSMVPSQTQHNVPAAMRTSIVFGQIEPNTDRYESAKEKERRQWLEELDKQREEKRLQQLKEVEKSQPGTDTWADKFSNVHKPNVLPEQPVEPPGGFPDPFSPRDRTLDTGRVNSAPNQVTNTEGQSYIRGQNIAIDPLTRQELEEKRKRQLEHQRAVKEQVEAKQRQKQLEKERKMKEDMEEEKKLQAERDRIQRQFDLEQNKIKMKEQKRQHEVEKLKAAMDEAHEQAQREKISRRMQHLEQGGHDTTQLKATLQDTSRLTDRESIRDLQTGYIAKLTPRQDRAVMDDPPYVPGLNLDMSPRGKPVQAEVHDQGREKHPYTENRLLTPSQFRQGKSTRRHDEPSYPAREFGTQTGMGRYSPVDDNDFADHVDFDNLKDPQREPTEVQIIYNAQGKKVRVKSASMEEKSRGRLRHKPVPPKNEKRVVTKQEKNKENKEKPLWNFQNKKQKKHVKQSEKDLFYERKRKESQSRREKRVDKLLNLVEINRDRIPTEKYTPSHSRNQSPASERGGRISRDLDRNNRQNRRSQSHSPSGVEQRTWRAESPSIQNISSQSPSALVQISSNRALSPPVPALRHGGGGTDRQVMAHKYDDPLDFPVMNGDFVPITRTVDVLDPAKASSPLPISREATAITNARKAYLKGMHPGNYGKRYNNYEDRMTVPAEKINQKDPILNPSIVTDHPTHRQDAILQQLSSLKMNLLQRQRELETFSPTDFES